MNVTHLVYPDTSVSKFPFPQEISLEAVHKNQFFSNIATTIASSLIFSGKPLETLKDPYIHFFENLKCTVFEREEFTDRKANSMIVTIYNTVSLAAFFIPSLRNKLITSRIMSTFNTLTALTMITKKMGYIFKSKISLRDSVFLASEDPKDNTIIAKKLLTCMVTNTIITAIFFALAFKTPIHTALGRISYCTQSALKNWKITSWEALAESIQGIHTLTTAAHIIKVYYGDRKVNHLTAQLLDLDAPLFICAKAFSFYLNTKVLN